MMPERGTPTTKTKTPSSDESTQPGSTLTSSSSSSTEAAAIILEEYNKTERKQPETYAAVSNFRRCCCFWKHNNHKDNDDAVDPVQSPPPPPHAKRTSSSFFCSFHLQNYLERYIRRPILRTLLAVAHYAAHYPMTTIVLCLVTSTLLAVTGYCTNFTVVVDVETSFTPVHSYPARHRDWIYDESQFPQDRLVVMVLHAEGANVCAAPVAALDKIFAAVDAIRDLPAYASICVPEETTTMTHGKDPTANTTTTNTTMTHRTICELLSVTGFWQDSYDIYTNEIKGNNAWARQAMSADTLRNGIPVAPDLLWGHVVRDQGLVQACESYTITLRLPETEAAYDFETDILDTILALDDQWRENNQDDNDDQLRMSINVKRSFEDEALRAIAADLPLIPIVFVIMSIFTTLVFYQRDKIQSRSFLGFCAVCSVLLSLAASYGFLFILGVPITSLTQLLPFVVFGVGLDDAFILCGEYRRTCPTKTPPERIQDTIQHTGLSITMTSLTSSMAFALGGTSSVQAARWLAMYGFPAIAVDFLYQITFFVACIVLDERRIAQRRRDCCMCIVVPETDDDDLSWQPNSDEEDSRLEQKNYDLQLSESVDTTKQSKSIIARTSLSGQDAVSSVSACSSSSQWAHKRNNKMDSTGLFYRENRSTAAKRSSFDHRSVVSAPVMRSAKAIKASSTSIPKRTQSCEVITFSSVQASSTLSSSSSQRKITRGNDDTSHVSAHSAPTRARTNEKWKVAAPKRARSYDTGTMAAQHNSNKRRSMDSAHTETPSAVTVDTHSLERISEEKSTGTESSGESGGSNSILAEYSSMIHDQLVKNQNGSGCCAALMSLSPTAEEGHQPFDGIEVVSHEELQDQADTENQEILICSSDYEDEDLRTCYDAQSSVQLSLGNSDRRLAKRHSEISTTCGSVKTRESQSPSFWGRLPSKVFSGQSARVSLSSHVKQTESSTAPPQDTVLILNHGHAADRFMKWYARQLLRRPVQVIVIGLFLGLLAATIQSVTHLEQEFKYTDLVPRDSYLSEYSRVIDEFTSGSTVTTGVYFRHVNVSDVSIQEQMQGYLDDLVEQVPAIEGPPEYCWFVHFEQFVDYFAERLQNHTFEEKLDVFLEQDVFDTLYSRNIARNEQGEVTASRCFISIRFDYNSVHSQVDALLDQRKVTREQRINQGTKQWSFFTYIEFYDAWAFYNVVPRELGFVTVAGICSVTAIALMIIPHWTAVLFVFPMITILYIDLLGVMQWADVKINGTSFVALSMAIGLLVDFIMHVLLSYYEAQGNRQERVVTMLCTMGSSILLGGISTSLGTLPLAFSTSEVFRTIFVVFVGIVTLGLGHGLIFLPVVLSIIGPQGSLSHGINHDNDIIKRHPSATSSSGSSDEEI